ncbi:MAG: hypothetical protein JWM56_417 [Candidatus Peribacteria bacterium]|nr:hypothetical protein [Candidatus Peribacteria bacterium]
MAVFSEAQCTVWMREQTGLPVDTSIIKDKGRKEVLVVILLELELFRTAMAYRLEDIAVPRGLKAECTTQTRRIALFANFSDAARVMHTTLGERAGTMRLLADDDSALTDPETESDCLNLIVELQDVARTRIFEQCSDADISAIDRKLTKNKKRR